jgi:hypothetical protein
VFANDISCDLRDDYRALVAEGVAEDEATRRVLAEYSDEPDQVAVWLALAASQAEIGRLDETVKAKALALIDSGEALQHWLEAGAAELRGRKATLSRLRARLVGVQRAPMKLRREWRPDTDLEPGEVLWHRAPVGARLVRVVRVVRIEKNSNGTWPIVERLVGSWEQPPSPETVASVPAETSVRTDGNPNVRVPRPMRRAVYPFHHGEPSWQAAGFGRLGRVPARPGDDRARASKDVPWRLLADEMHSVGSA